MSKYKALQNKALHQGAYIDMCMGDGEFWTTNGHILIRALVDSDETPALKGQIDKRQQEQEPTSIQPLLDTLTDDSTVVFKPNIVEDWTNEAGLQLTRAAIGDVEISVQSLYVDYANARFAHLEWWIMMKDDGMPGCVFATQGNQVMVVIAPVKDISNQVKEEE